MPSVVRTAIDDRATPIHAFKRRKREDEANRHAGMAWGLRV
ncbi:hypothetical protein C357_12104 [Citreicella sp. 357]|nr:hypothetical protein C357_12104 [Citreicella sp. 357]